MTRPFGWAFALGLLVLGGCGHHVNLGPALNAHDLGAARSDLDRSIESSGGEGLLYLERATVRAATGDFRGSAADFASADHLVDIDDLVRNKSDKPRDARHYRWLRGWEQRLNRPIGLKVYERLLAPSLSALSRMEVEDWSGACVDARRDGAIADYTSSFAPGRARGVREFGELTTAIACGAANEEGLACTSLGRVGGLAPLVDEARFARRCTAVSAANAKPKAGTDVWIVFAYGRASQPHTYATESKYGAPFHTVLAAGPQTERVAVDATLDGAVVELVDVDIDAAAREDYDDVLHAPELGNLHPEWRQWSLHSWQTVPARLAIGRVVATEGAHQVVIQTPATRVERTIRPGKGPRVVFALLPW